MTVLVMLLTWLWLSSTNDEAGSADEAMRALDDFSMAERALHRDVLSARIGMLRNYDPLVREVNALRDSVERLRSAAAHESEIEVAANHLAAQIEEQEQWTEQFKSHNALLQNSLSHFGLLSAQLSMAHQDAALVQRVGALATAFLELTFDPSPTVAAEVDDRLQRMSIRNNPSGENTVLAPLLAHARQLRALLPETDTVVRSVFAVPRNGESEAIRGLLLARKNNAEGRAKSFRHILYATSLLLLGSLTYLALSLQYRARSLRRRAAMEHVIASISTRFINSRPRDVTAHVEIALEELALHLGAARAYFVVGGERLRTYRWSRRGVHFPSGWPKSALQISARFARQDKEAVQIPDVCSLEAGDGVDALLAADLQGWLFIPSRSEQRSHAVLGFDTLRPGPIARAEELSLLRMACDAIENAVSRECLQRDRERLEANLQHARRMETVGALTSGIAHNFNNIIGAILGYTETAQAYVGPERRSVESLSEIRRAAERARDLVGQILTFGRGGALRTTRISLEALVSEAKSLLDVSLGADVKIAVLQTSQVAFVRGAPAHLQQVVLNVCKNAAQAMDQPGTIEIEINAHHLSLAMQTNTGELPPGRYAVIAVTDPGRGMDETTQERMFEPFFSSRLEGNGLGLATVREIVLQHYGAIRVQSAPGVGTRFEIWLPCVTPEQLLLEKDKDGDRLSGRGAGETVLVLEADRDRLLRHEEILAALGYEPVGFSYPAEALGALRAAPNRFDAALLCCHLHGVDVMLDLANDLRAIAPPLPLILATASPSDFGAPSLAGAGIEAVVQKPFTSGELADALAGICSKRNVPHQLEPA
jgi:signal transduction histidine kinase/CheY-like chemotaxis protein